MKRFLQLLLILMLMVLAISYWLRPEGGELPRSTSTGKAQIGGKFEAVSHLGQPFTDADLTGHYSLMYFGFTYCPDICPAGLTVIANAIDMLPDAQQSQLLPVFVTIDPKRDTVAVMADYVSNFHEKLIGVTGTAEQMAEMAKEYKVYFNKVPSESGGTDYLVDHSGYLYLMGPDGQYITHYPHNVSVQALADSLHMHIQQ